MSYQGNNPKYNTQAYRPQAADPLSPIEGMVFRSDGTSREKGLWEYRDASWQKIGSDSAGSINLLAQNDSDFEAGLSNWVTYKDAAAASPVDGTGGAAVAISAAVTSSASEILVGTRSLKISKSAANGQGEGVSVLSLNVDRAFRGTSLALNLEIDAAQAANYVAGDMKIFLYDVTNAVLMPYSEQNNGSIQKQKYSTSLLFTSESTTTQIRVIIHCATVSALAYDLILDNVILTLPEIAAVPITQESTVSLAGSGGFSTGSLRVARAGSVVTISTTSSLTYSSATSISSAAGVIPEWARPTLNSQNATQISATGVFTTQVLTDGTFNISARDWAGTSVASTSLSNSTISYTIDTQGTISGFANQSILDFQSAQSGTKTPTATNTYQALTGNSVNLKAGRVYDISGSLVHSQSGSAGITQIQAFLATANGADSAAVPAKLQASGSIQMLSVNPSDLVGSFVGTNYANGSTETASQEPITTVRVRVLSDITVYLDTFITASTPASARIKVYLEAREVPFSTTSIATGAIKLGTETWVSSEVNSSASAILTRNGPYLEGLLNISVSGAFSGSSLDITIPSVYASSSSYSFTDSKRVPIGQAEIRDAGSAYFAAVPYLTSSTNIRIAATNASATYTQPTNLTSTIPMTWANGDFITVNFRFLVDGW